MKVGDVVKLHCPDPRCKCCDDLPVGVIVSKSTDPHFDWKVKLLFEHTYEWQEKYLILVEESPCSSRET